eukprot:SAG31_NODE_10235_length_1166_cov_1.295220_1_plen_185_part_00
MLLPHERELPTQNCFGVAAPHNVSLGNRDSPSVIILNDAPPAVLEYLRIRMPVPLVPGRLYNVVGHALPAPVLKYGYRRWVQLPGTDDPNVYLNASSACLVLGGRPRRGAGGARRDDGTPRAIRYSEPSQAAEAAGTEGVVTTADGLRTLARRTLPGPAASGRRAGSGSAPLPRDSCPRRMPWW